MQINRWRNPAPLVGLGLWFALQVFSPVAATSQRPLNLGFELPSVADSTMPWGWSLGWSAFGSGPAATFSLDGTVRHEGRTSLRISMVEAHPDAAPQTIILQVPADLFLGRDVSLSAWVRTDGSGNEALVTLEAWGDGEFVAADSAELSESGASEWTNRRLSIRVPDDPTVHSLAIGTVLRGTGTAWFDDFTLEVDGEAIAALAPNVGPPSAAELHWLGGHTAPLRSLRNIPGAPFDDADLGLFADIVGDARIVALGESTHGTREFFQVKHRLLEYLVRSAGFTVFAIEANQLAVEKINLFVSGGAGTARDVMRVMFRVWNTESMLALVEWLREYNATHPERMVRFAGYDMQDHQTPADTLLAFLEREGPDLVAGFREMVGEYREQPRAATPGVADTVRARWHRQAEQLWRTVSGRNAAWLSAATNREDTTSVRWAVQAANLLRQSASFNVDLSSPERDSLMAANLDWFLRVHSPGARAVVWAHDVHVSRGGDPELSFNGGEQMGAYLSRIYGDEYRAFSLLTYAGSYSATRSFTDHRMIAAEAFVAPAGSNEAAFHDLPNSGDAAGLTIDLRSASTDDRGSWLMRARPIRHIGYAAYDYGFEISAILPLEFDGVIFVDRTTPSRLLP